MAKVDCSKAPEGATHYLAGGPNLLWYQVGQSVCLWHGGWVLVKCLPPISEAIPATQAPDWSDAPPRATHYVHSSQPSVEPGWYVADGVKMRLIGRDDEYIFRLDDVHHGCGLTLVERPAVAPDWAAAPEGTTHHAPAITLKAFYYPPRWLKDEGGSFMYANWENDWFWRPYGSMQRGRVPTLIARPVAEPAQFSPEWATAPDDATHHTRDKCEAPWRKVVGGDVFMWHRGAWELIGMPAGLGKYVQRPAVEFVPFDFSGEVRDYGPAKKLAEISWTAAPEWATLFLVHNEHPNMYAWAAGFDKGAKFARLDGAPGPGALLPQFWQVVGERVTVWNGEGNPPIGTDCIVRPHNSQWGFPDVSDYVCDVAGYHGELVWLISAERGSVISRIDKVDFLPRRTPEQIASEARIAAAQVWLKDVEEKYGKAAADKCEDILMEAEASKKVKP
jgi:hypothetical protein